MKFKNANSYKVFILFILSMLVINADMYATDPPEQATDISLSLLRGKSTNREITIYWSHTPGSNCVVFIKEGMQTNKAPIDNETYIDDPSFSKGTQIDESGWYCVYSGISDSCIVNSLLIDSYYNVMVCSFIGDSGNEKYNSTLTTGNRISFSTQPDLVVEKINIPDYIPKGESFELEFNVTNNGPASFKPSPTTLKVYVSEDDIFDEDDTYVGYKTISSISGYVNEFENTENFNTWIIIPESFVEGKYNILLYIDPDDIVKEANELNNIGIIKQVFISNEEISAPIINEYIENQTITIVNNTFSYTFPENNFLFPQGDVVTYKALQANNTSLPEGIEFNPSTLTFTGDISIVNIENLNITIFACNQNSICLQDTFLMEFQNSNPPELQYQIMAQYAYEGKEYVLTIEPDIFIDPDEDDEITYTLTLENGDDLPQWLLYNVTDGTLSGTPTYKDIDSLSLLLTATDKTGEKGEHIFGLKVFPDCAESYFVKGNVFIDNILLAKGKIQLLSADDNQFMIKREADIINGDYQVNYVCPGKYVIKAIAGGANKNKYLETYYVNKLKPEDAIVIDVTYNASQLNFHLLADDGSGIEEGHFDAQKIQLHQNPVSENLSFSYYASSNSILVQIFNISTGKIIDEESVQNPGNNIYTLPIKKLAKGNYFLCIIDGANSVVKRFVKL